MAKFQTVLLAALLLVAGFAAWQAKMNDAALADLQIQTRQAGEASFSRNVELRQSIESLDRAVKFREGMLRGLRNGVGVNGRLGVAGTQLVNQFGKSVQLRGMSSHGLVWYPQYVNARALFDLKSRGANLFRAAMYSDSGSGGYNENPEAKRLNTMYLYLAVENALAADMYAIVDWHLLMDENPMKTVDSAVEFFDAISRRYADEPGVLYEICNEPNGETTWDDIHEYAQRVIPAIRKNAPKAVILVGTPHYSADLPAVKAKPLDFDNIMYTYHMYTGYSQGQYKELIPAALRDGFPVFVSEWGISDDEATGRLDAEEGREFIDFMKKNSISWAYWSLCNSDEPFSVLKPETIALSGWTENDLSPAGRIVFAAFGE